MSEPGKDETIKEPEAGAIDFNFNMNDISKNTDAATKKLLQDAVKTNKELAAELAELKKDREEQKKLTEKTKLDEYNGKRTKILEEMAEIAPHLLEEHKESHLNRLEDVIKTARTYTNKLHKLKGTAKEKLEEDEVFFAYDRVKKENPNK